jgi:outer membrane protein OmpA-like peptidoglycan-associated protein
MQVRSSIFSRPVRALTLAVLAASMLSACATAPRKTGLNETQIAVLKEQGFKLTEDGWMFGIPGKILFANDEATLNEESRPNIEALATTLLRVDINAVRLEGHTDSQGTAEYNQRLSVRRAEAVAEVFVESGMQRSNVQAVGMGMSKPVADNQTPAGRLENRRVAVIVPVE